MVSGYQWSVGTSGRWSVSAMVSVVDQWVDASGWLVGSGWWVMT